MTLDEEYLPFDRNPIGATDHVIVGGMSALEMWRVQLSPLLMQMSQDTRGDGMARGVILLGGKKHVKITVSLFDANEINTPGEPGATILTPVALGNA